MAVLLNEVGPAVNSVLSLGGHTMTAELKPFVLNIGDLSFLLNQVSLRPLFDASGALILNWDGTGEIYATSEGAAGGPALNLGSTLTPAEAIATWGSSYYSVADAGGLRDVSGLSNNLDPANAAWGAADVPFLTVGASGNLGYGNYLNPAADYTITAADFENGTIGSVVDYTPRMITQTIATGGVKMLIDERMGLEGQLVYWNTKL